MGAKTDVPNFVYNKVSDLLDKYDQGDMTVKPLMEAEMNKLREFQNMFRDALVPAGRCLMLVPPRDFSTSDSEIHNDSVWRPTLRNPGEEPFITPGGCCVIDLGGTVSDLGEVVVWEGMLTDHLPCEAYRNLTGNLAENSRDFNGKSI